MFDKILVTKTMCDGILQPFQTTSLDSPAALLLEFFCLTEQPSLVWWLSTNSDDLSSDKII